MTSPITRSLASALAVACTVGTLASAQTYRVDLPSSAGFGRHSLGPAGQTVLAHASGGGTEVVAIDAHGQVRWTRRLEYPGSSFSSGSAVLATADGGALVAGGDRVVRLGPLGGVVSAFALPDPNLAPAEFVRLSDGRVVLVGTSFGVNPSPIQHLEVADDGSATRLPSQVTTYGDPNHQLNAAGNIDCEAVQNGGWVTTHRVQSMRCCTVEHTTVRWRADGSIQWALRLGQGVMNSAAPLPGGRTAVCNQSRLLVVGPAGQIEAAYEFAGPEPDSVGSIAATPGGGLLVALTSGRLVELGPGLQVLWARDVAGLAPGFFRTMEVGADGAISIFNRTSLGPRILRLAADGDMYGACAPQTQSVAMSLVPATVPPQIPANVTANLPADVAPAPANVTTLPWTGSTTLACADLRPRLVPLGGQIGATLSFQHEHPGFPNSLSILVLGASGAGSLPLPSGLDAGVAPDALTFALLQSPSLSIANLDATGFGTTAAIAIPLDPGLAGTPLTFAGLGLDPVAIAIGQATLPVTLTLN